MLASYELYDDAAHTGTLDDDIYRQLREWNTHLRIYNASLPRDILHEGETNDMPDAVSRDVHNARQETLIYA